MLLKCCTQYVNKIVVEEIKKMRQEYTEELYKKVLNDSGNHDDMYDHSPRARHLGM